MVNLEAVFSAASSQDHPDDQEALGAVADSQGERIDVAVAVAGNQEERIDVAVAVAVGSQAPNTVYQ